MLNRNQNFDFYWADGVRLPETPQQSNFRRNRAIGRSRVSRIPLPNMRDIAGNLSNLTTSRFVPGTTPQDFPSGNLPSQFTGGAGVTFPCGGAACLARAHWIRVPCAAKSPMPSAAGFLPERVRRGRPRAPLRRFPGMPAREYPFRRRWRRLRRWHLLAVRVRVLSARASISASSTPRSDR